MFLYQLLWKKHRRWQRLLIILGGLLCLGWIGLYQWLLADLPSLDEIEGGMALPSTRIYDRNGRLLYEIVDLYDGSHAQADLDTLPECLIQATIATEDANFYRHPGVDAVGILRATWLNLRGGEVRAGGSTITQQVARNLLLKDEMSERSVRRKLREMILALRLNAAYSRAEILELYLNHSYYGNMAYGVEAASQAYFGRSAQNLSLAQCALLAGLPQAPALYSPLINPTAAQNRQTIVLDLMVKEGFITPEEAEIAKAEDIHYAAAIFPIQAPHFVAAVWTQLERNYPDELREGGLRVTTTLDLSWQKAAEDITNLYLDELNSPSDGSPSKNANNAALVAIDPYTGQILTMLGSPDYFNEAIDGNVNAALAPRQPGSALKPFTYAATFDPNLETPWTPAKMILDVGTPFVTRRLESYTPSNFGLTEHGPVRIREALASSYNIPAVVALDYVGLDALIRLTTRLGISTLTDSSRFDLSLTLGGGEVRLLELTAAYAAFANQGQHIAPAYLLKVEDAKGNILYEWKQPNLGVPELDPRVAYLITSILSDDDARFSSFGRGSALSIGARPSAAKTGTTTDYRDNWTIGYTPNLVVGVWVGNANNTPMIDVSGVTGAGPIWNQFIRRVLDNQPMLAFSVPEGIVRAEICAISGLLPTPECATRAWEWFIEGTVPTEYDNLYQKFEIDTTNGQLADENTPSENRAERVFLVLPPEARAWAISQAIPTPPLGAQLMSYEDYPVRLLAPDPYTVFQLTTHTPLETQRLQLSASYPTNTKAVEYWLNGEQLAIAQQAPFTHWWPLTAGEHTLWAVAILESDEQVTSPTVQFRVNAWVPPNQRPSRGEAE